MAPAPETDSDGTATDGSTRDQASVKVPSKDPEKKDEDLSTEDLALTQQLELYVAEVQHSDPGLQKAALESMRSEQAEKVDEENNSITEEKAPPISTLAGSGSSLVQGEDTVSKRENLVVNKSSSRTRRGKKSSPRSKNPSSKRKMKVDWTPELHMQFVQALEKLGVDKAVPSKILELMGIDFLTRYNVASHLQKYRSQRKHMIAREAEAATWSHRRQICGTTGRTGKSDVNSWIVPATGFPPVIPNPHIRPLHVWGHPSAGQSLEYMWPGHVACSPSPPPWAPPCHPQPSGDPYFWYYQHQDVPAPGMPCYQPHYLPTRFTTVPVPGVLPTSMYRIPPSIGVPMTPNGEILPQPSFDSHPSKESIDAVIGEVLSKPWLPLPVGLKPPAVDSVMSELQRQGISKIPPPICV